MSLKLEGFCEDLIRRLKKPFLHQDNPSKTFAPHGSAKIVFENSDLDPLLDIVFDGSTIDAVRRNRYTDRLLGRDGHDGLCNILAIILFTRGRNQALRQFRKFVETDASDNEETLLQYTDRDLPFDSSTAERLFTTAGSDFYTEQFKFCPVVLKKHQEGIYTDHRKSCPLPYRNEEHIGTGAFSYVFKVGIERGHWIEEEKGLINDRPLLLARKDFKLNRGNAFQDERKVIREILRQNKSHSNIMTTLSSLEYDNTFSLFFPLAKYNLWEYLSNTPSDRKITAPSTLEEKRIIFNRGVGLAGALAFLHEELALPTYERICCYHLDLKPDNILVVDGGNGQELWQITDFGMSRVKRVKRVSGLQGGWDEVDFGSLFTSTENRRGEGTYMAPESEIKGRMGAESDVWSFGCVFSLVMSFIDDGPQGVWDFGEARNRRNSRGNHFYITDPDNPEGSINPGVLDWFVHLQEQACKKGHVEGEIFRQTLKFLEQKVLIPNQESRKKTRAKVVEMQLREISALFEKTDKACKAPLVPANPKKSLVRRAWNRITNNVPQPSKFTVCKNHDGARISPNRDFMVFYSPEVVELFSMTNSNLTDRSMHKMHKQQNDWEGVSLNSSYLYVYTKASYFEFYSYHLPEISLSIHIRHQDIGSIQKLEISPDNNLIACAVKRRSGIRVLLFHREEIARSEASGCFLMSSRVIQELTDFGTVRVGIWALAFSSNSRVLTVITEPSRYATNGTEKCGTTVRSWDTCNGTNCANFNLENEGFSDLRASLLTAYALFNTSPKPLIISQRSFIYYYRSESDKICRSPRMRHRLYAALVTEEDEEIILLADSGKDYHVKAYRLKTSEIESCEGLHKGTTTGLTSRDLERDYAYWSMLDSESGKRTIYITTSNGRIFSIALS